MATCIIFKRVKFPVCATKKATYAVINICKSCNIHFYIRKNLSIYVRMALQCRRYHRRGFSSRKTRDFRLISVSRLLLVRTVSERMYYNKTKFFFFFKPNINKGRIQKTRGRVTDTQLPVDFVRVIRSFSNCPIIKIGHS